jgi:aquaporin Z
MSKIVAEFIGTFALVLFGCGAAVLGGDHVGQLGTALAFGFAIIALAYGIGPVSGCHVNPAVSLAAFVAGRMTVKEMLFYWGAQFSGALAGAAVLACIAGGTSHGLGQNGWGPGYLGAYPLQAAFVFEVVMTALFVIVILGATGADAAPGFAGLGIGIALAVIHIVGIQLWLFFVAPTIGAILGALLYRFRILKVG